MFRLVASIITLIEFQYTIARHPESTQCSHGYHIKSTESPNAPQCYHGPQSMLQYLIHPTPVDHFIDSYFDRQPLLIRRHHHQYYQSINILDSYHQILSKMDSRSDILDDASGIGPFPELNCKVFQNGTDSHVKPWRLDQNQRYLTSLSPQQIHDIHSYHDSLNHDLGPWDLGAVQFMSSNNYTLKFFKLEYHLNSLRNVCSALSNELGFGVRSNMYLTPSFSKGFPAHYDIEEAWILQIEHTKHWKVYRPLHHYCTSNNDDDGDGDGDGDHDQHFTFNDPSDLCQRSIVSELSTLGYHQIRERLYSMEQCSESTVCSLNNNNNDDSVYNPMDFVLEPGDLLYIPRGWMHEADALEQDTHSMHITLGVYLELNADYLLKFVRFMFTIDDLQNVFLKVFVVQNQESNESNDIIKKMRKYLLKDFEPWLRTVAFKEEVLRESVRYFYHLGDDDEQRYVRMCQLFRVYFGYYMNYVHRQMESNNALKVVMKGDNFENYINQFMRVLVQDTVRLRLERKLQRHYRKTVQSFDGVFQTSSKKVRKSFKTVSMPMRLDGIRKQIPTLL